MKKINLITEPLRFIFSNADKVVKRALLLGLFYSLGIEALALLVPLLTGSFIDMHVNREPFEVWIIPVIFAVLAYFGSSLLQYLQYRNNVKNIAYRLPRLMSFFTMPTILDMSGRDQQGQSSNENKSRIGRGIGQAKNLNQIIFREVIPTAVFIVTLIVFLAFTHIEFMVLALLSTIVILAIVFSQQVHFALTLKEAEKNWDKTHAVQNEIIGNISYIQDTASESFILNYYKKLYNFAEKVSVTRWVTYVTKTFKAEVVFSLSMGGALFMGGLFMTSGKISVGEFTYLFSWIAMLLTKVKHLRQMAKQVSYLITPLSTYIDLMKSVQGMKYGTKEAIAYGKLSFKNVSFAYEKGTMSLENVSFSIQPGQKVALVGQTGSGKSTIVRLIMRHFDPTSGGVYIDNTPLVDYAKTIKHHIGYVGQDSPLFDLSVRDNITQGKDFSDEEIYRVLAKVNLKNRISEFDNGLETIIGENGLKLSGGEKQRLSIARVLIQNPKILIFDEATSALDAQTQKEVQDAIDKASEGKTTILIAHRLSTIVNADKIVYLEEGKVKHVLPFTKLLEKEEAFKRNVELELGKSSLN